MLSSIIGYYFIVLSSLTFVCTSKHSTIETLHFFLKWIISIASACMAGPNRKNDQVKGINAVRL